MYQKLLGLGEFAPPPPAAPGAVHFESSFICCTQKLGLPPLQRNKALSAITTQYLSVSLSSLHKKGMGDRGDRFTEDLVHGLVGQRPVQLPNLFKAKTLKEMVKNAATIQSILLLCNKNP